MSNPLSSTSPSVRRRRRHFPFLHLLLLSSLVPSLLGCGDIPLSGRYEGTFEQTVQLRKTLFLAGGNSEIRQEEIAHQQDGPVLIAMGVDVDAVLDGLACPAIPLMFRERDLVLDRRLTCETSVEVESTVDDTIRRDEQTVTIEVVDLEVVEIERGFIDVIAEMRRERVDSSEGRRTLLVEEDISLHFKGVQVAAAVGAMQ